MKKEKMSSRFLPAWSPGLYGPLYGVLNGPVVGRKRGISGGQLSQAAKLAVMPSNEIYGLGDEKPMIKYLGRGKRRAKKSRRYK